MKKTCSFSWRTALFSFFIINFALPASAGGASGAAFLKVGVDARAAALGGADTVLIDDAGAVFANPAGMARMTRREALAGHGEWLDGMDIENAAYAHPNLLGGTVGVGYVMLNAGTVEQRDAQRRSVGAFTACDSALTLSYAKEEGLARVGVGVKIIEQRLAAQHARGMALDAGFLRALPLKGLTAGLAVRNLGPKMAFDDGRPFSLPMEWKAGLGYTPSRGLFVALDMNYQPAGRRLQAVLATEYQPMRAMALRAGYKLNTKYEIRNTKETTGTPNNFAGVNMGMGLVFDKNYRLDYAVTPAPGFGLLHNISLAVKF